jgi:hypothetical protein
MSILYACLARGKSVPGLLLVAILAAQPQHAVGQDFQQSTFSCTKLSRSFWLPLSTLVARLQDSGHVVAFALTTPDDCYELMVRSGEGVLRTILFHPVSGKPLD